MNWVSKYVGLEFEDGGRGPELVDCWGLICLVYRDELNIELNPFADISARNLIAVAKAMNSDANAEQWEDVSREELREFDVIGLTQYGSRFVAHVGLYTGAGKVLHSEAGCNTVSVGLDHVSVRERIKCFRRHKKMSLRFGVNLLP